MSDGPPASRPSLTDCPAPPDDGDARPYRPCVGICLIDPRGRIFVGRRRDTPEAWQMPQGGIDPGEAPVDAALRELVEETGTDRAEVIDELAGWLAYDLPADLRGRVMGGKWRGQAQKWFAMRFTGRDADIDLEAHHAEFDAWRWADPDSVRADIVVFKRAIYDRVLDAFAPHFGPR